MDYMEVTRDFSSWKLCYYLLSMMVLHRWYLIYVKDV
mgnify:CR=1 FL=1